MTATYCSTCGYPFTSDARFCPGCAAPVTPGTKAVAIVSEVGDKAVDLTKRAAEAAKPAATGAVRLTGKALAKVGSWTQQAGRKLEGISSGPTDVGAGPAAGPGADIPATPLIDVNTATVKELAGLPGIGRVKANSIVANRPFGSVEDLLAVPGISHSLFDRLKGRLYVAPREA